MVNFRGGMDILDLLIVPSAAKDNLELKNVDFQYTKVNISCFQICFQYHEICLVFLSEPPTVCIGAKCTQYNKEDYPQFGQSKTPIYD